MPLRTVFAHPLFLLLLAGCAASATTIPSGPIPGAGGRPEPSAPMARADATLPPPISGRDLTLREVLALVLLRSPELSASSWEVRAAEARALQAGLMPNPELEFEASEFGGVGGRSGFTGAEMALSVSQVVELGGKRRQRKRVATLRGRLARWDDEIARQDALTEAAKAFVDVLTAQEALALREDVVHLMERTYETVVARVDSGKVPPLEKSKANVALAMQRLRLDRQRRQLQDARKRLAATWASTTPEFKSVVGDLHGTHPVPQPERLEALLVQNPDLARWAAEMAMRRAAVDMERANAVPDVTVRGGIGRFAETEDQAFLAGVSFPLPLFDRNQGGICEAQADVWRAAAQRRAAEVRTRTALAEAYQSLAAAATEAETLEREVLPAAQAAFDAADEGYSQGKFAYLDVLDAQRTLYDAREQLIDALAGYHRAAADLERLVGQRLTSAGEANKKESK